MSEAVKKVLIVRFSSFGDVVQSMVAIEAIKSNYPEAEIDFVTRNDYYSLVKNNPLLSNTYCFDKKSGFRGLLELNKWIKSKKYTHIYDAHNNTRSNLLWALGFINRCIQGTRWIQRPKNRWKRFLLFNFKINRFPWPFVLMKSYLAPLAPLGVSKELPMSKHLYLDSSSKDKAKELCSIFSEYIVLAPSAAWELKRWPIEYWTQLIKLKPEENFVLLGGPQDDFIEEIRQAAIETKEDENRILNLAGKTTYSESCSVIEGAKTIIGGDSGLTHVGDSFKIKTICLIGAAAFSHPAHSTTHVLNSQLSCQPCSKDGRGECKNKIYKKCLYDISPKKVIEVL
ncbi:MAG: glycosyltransferase family 9 protein [Bdellovibrionales bacterium]